ncbi:MAG TPA: hypothetical protein VHK90_00995, partial [Thermoanaerobaculia bacterium]|nr:hypothetical protein [Thermoanaerobaculia bacterium]
MSEIPVPVVPAAPKYKLVTILLFAQLPILLIAGYLAVSTFSMTSMWATVAISMLALLMALGESKGRVGGILINERNIMSLSRFQLVAWTLVLCSAFAVVAVARVAAGVDDPLKIELQPELWQLLGITGGSSVGAALVIQNKTNKKAAPDEVTKASAALNESTESIEENSRGLAYGNKNPGDARVTDMFEGDEVANTAYIDMSKVQMFFFTLVCLIAYAVALGEMMSTTALKDFTSFPTLDSGLLALLGI